MTQLRGKAAVLAVAAIMAATGAHGRETRDLSSLWSFVDRNGAFYQLEKKEVRERAPVDSVTVWLTADHSRDRGVVYRKSRQRVTLDCHGFYQVTAFASFMSDGSLKEAWERSDERQRVKSGSYQDNLQATLCR